MSRYSNIKQNVDSSGISYYKNVLYPAVPLNSDDLYAITVDGDRLDKLSLEFYGDESFWWIIASANPELRIDSLCLEPGIQIRIPVSVKECITLYGNINT